MWMPPKTCVVKKRSLVPLPDKPILANRQICVFGDSHIACLRYAVVNRLVPRRFIDIEFWGTAGNRFRYLTYADGAIRPTDEFTARRFAAINSRGREELRPDDFEMVLFMGCRTRVNGVFMDFLHRAHHPGLFLSTGVKREIVRAHLRHHYCYQFATAFAAQRRARIVYAPVSLQSFGIGPGLPADFADAQRGTAAERAAIWQLVGEVMAEDGITLIAQDDSTVVEGCFTDPAYAVNLAAERRDGTHKNAAYGAIVLEQALNLLHAMPAPAGVVQTLKPRPKPPLPTPTPAATALPQEAT